MPRNNKKLGGTKVIGTKDVNRIQGATAVDRTGHKIGKVGHLYVDRQNQEPRWITVSTGLFGMSESFIPLQGADFDGENIRVAYDKDTVKDAPRIDADQDLEENEERELYRHYHLGPGWEQRTGDEGLRGRTDTEHAMTLSEERLAAGKETEEAGHARLRKYTTTHKETVEVPVTKEELVVERTPATGEREPGHIGDSGEQVEDITLHEERPVVSKETVPVEDVRIGKERVTETERVSGEVRKEHADVDVEDDRRRTGRGTEPGTEEPRR